jgi:hypothetical protein
LDCDATAPAAWFAFPIGSLDHTSLIGNRRFGYRLGVFPMAVGNLDFPVMQIAVTAHWAGQVLVVGADRDQHSTTSAMAANTNGTTSSCNEYFDLLSTKSMIATQDCEPSYFVYVFAGHPIHLLPSRS